MLTNDRLTVSFKMEKKTVILELEKNKNIPQLASYYTTENDKLVKKSLGEGQVTYSHYCWHYDKIVLTRNVGQCPT